MHWTITSVDIILRIVEGFVGQPSFDIYWLNFKQLCTAESSIAFAFHCMEELHKINHVRLIGWVGWVSPAVTIATIFHAELETETDVAEFCERLHGQNSCDKCACLLVPGT